MTVHFYAHDEPNAPVLTGENGAAINVVEACAITGFGARAPIGSWAAAYAGTDKRAWHSTHVDGLGHLFQCLDDGSSASGARGATLRGYETMTSVDAGANPFPTTAQQTAPSYGVWKSQTADITPRPWWLVGDDLFLYLITAPRSREFVEIVYFGQLAASRKPGDGYHSVVGANKNLSATTANEGYYTAAGKGDDYLTASGPAYIARPYNQSAGAAALGHWTWNHANPGQGGLIHPHGPDGGTLFSAPRLVEAGPNLRGVLPGLYIPWHYKPYPHLSVIDAVDTLPGRDLLALCTHGDNSVAGQVLIDTTGPWR